MESRLVLIQKRNRKYLKGFTPRANGVITEQDWSTLGKSFLHRILDIVGIEKGGILKSKICAGKELLYSYGLSVYIVNDRVSLIILDDVSKDEELEISHLVRDSDYLLTRNNNSLVIAHV